MLTIISLYHIIAIYASIFFENANYTINKPTANRDWQVTERHGYKYERKKIRTIFKEFA